MDGATPGKPVCCGSREGCGFAKGDGDAPGGFANGEGDAPGGFANGDGDDDGRVGTKPEKPVVVGTRGCSNAWFAGTGANGPRGPLTGEADSMPVCWACNACPIGTGEVPMPMPVAKPTGVEIGGDIDVDGAR